MSDANQAVLIGLDWGTTSFRANLLGPEGTVLDNISSSEGILASQKSFEDTLERHVHHWLARNPNMPVLASGMITSRNGWIETPYQKTPSRVSGFAASLVMHKTNSGMTVHFVGGLSHQGASDMPDIIRGEETQIIGALVADPPASKEDRIYLLPGTHSKWVETSGDQLTGFSTYMTGEFYALAINHSILGTLAGESTGSVSDGFTRGFETRLDSRQSILHLLFGSRTLAIFDQIKDDEISDFISGLFIGEEILAARNNGALERSQVVRIVGRSDLVDRYTIALEAAGFTPLATSEDIVSNGHFAIAKNGGLLT